MNATVGGGGGLVNNFRHHPTGGRKSMPVAALLRSLLTIIARSVDAVLHIKAKTDNSSIAIRMCVK